MRLRNKVIFSFMLVVLANAVGLSIVCRVMLKPVFIADSKDHMESYGIEVEKALAGDSDSITELLMDINAEYSITATVVNENFEVLYTQYGNRTKVGQQTRRRTINIIQKYKRENKDPYITEYYDESDKTWRIYYVHQTKDKEYIILSKAIKGIDQDISIMTKFVYITIFVLAVCCIILWCIMTGGFTKRLEAMSRVTKKMSQLDFNEKVNYRSGDEIGVLAESIDDLSDKLKENIEKMQMELERRKALVRNLSHEIRTPVTTIRGFAENTQIVADTNEKARHYCDIIIEECDALDIMTREMIEMSSLEDGGFLYEKKKLRTDQILGDIQQRVARELSGEPICIDMESQIIEGNAYLLEQAVFNFLKNAVKYKAEGTDIILQGYAQNGRYIFSVINEGESIPEKEQKLIWDVFYKVDKSRKRCGNYGIGLSIVKKIAEMHGGETDVKCRDGKTTFIFWVPICGES